MKKNTDGNTCIYYNIIASFKYKEKVVLSFAEQEITVYSAFEKYLKKLEYYSTEQFSDEDSSIY